MTMLPGLATLALVVAMMALVWRLLRRRYRLETPADEVHHAPTGDGWELALYRYRPRESHAGREPVILCHGMLSNRFNIDLDESTSLARYLRSRGFDVWVMELRGHGGSRRVARNGLRPYDWTIDDYIARDVVAAIGAVRRETGAARVHWFGHSLGGMILYGACALEGVAGTIRSAVLSDAPASFRSLRRRTGIARLYGRIFPVVPPALVLPFLGPAVWVFPRLMSRRYGIGERSLIMSLLSNAITPWGSCGVLLQLCEFLETGRFRSVDGSVDYETGPGRITFPLLVLSSSRKLMNEEAIRAGLDRAPSPIKKYLRFGRSLGHAIDYTHSNLILSPSSAREVFPEVAGWFATNSGGGPPTQNVSV